MSTQTPTAYIVTPIDKNPDKQGQYIVMNNDLVGKELFIEGRWNTVRSSDLTHWLRPVDLSRLLEEAWEAGAQSESNCIKPEGDCGYDATQHEVDKINYLKSVLNPPK